MVSMQEIYKMTPTPKQQKRLDAEFAKLSKTKIVRKWGKSADKK